MDVCLFQKWLVVTTVNSKLKKKSTLVSRENIYNINVIIHYVKKQTIKKLQIKYFFLYNSLTKLKF